MVDQATFDETRRRLAACVLKSFAEQLDDEEMPPAAVVGGLLLAAGILAHRCGLEDVMPYVSQDVDGDVEGLARGDWTLDEALERFREALRAMGREPVI